MTPNSRPANFFTLINENFEDDIDTIKNELANSGNNTGSSEKYTSIIKLAKAELIVEKGEKLCEECLER